tara:strand:- start:16 stop:471 length:456 start_codon:yes stop_codon:yes gene_type:complete
MSYNPNINIGQDTFNKFNDLGTHFIESLFDIATPIINNVSGINVQQPNQWQPFSNINETETLMKIMISLPGVEKKDINVILKQRVLDITAKTNVGNKDWEHIKERTYRKTIKIPNNIQNNDLQSSYENGILKILIYKTNASNIEGEKIEIN